MDKDNQQNSSSFMQRNKVSPLSNSQEEKSRNGREVSSSKVDAEERARCGDVQGVR